MKMKTTIVLHVVYCDVTYPEYLHVPNRYYKNLRALSVFRSFFLAYIFKNAIERHPEDWSWKNVSSQQTLSLNTIFSYGKEYRDWT